MSRKTKDIIEDLGNEAESITISTVDNEGHTVILGNMDEYKKRLFRAAGNTETRPEVIRQAVIVDSTKLNVAYTVERKSGTETTGKKCPDPVHDDLRIAFSKLKDHLGRLCYQPLTEHNPEYKKDKTLPALICPLHCTGFKISGKEDNESVILYGTRTLPNAKEIDLQSPSQKYEDDIFEYEHSEELKQLIGECVSEVEMYLFEGKHAPDVQGDLFEQQEESTDEQEED